MKKLFLILCLFTITFAAACYVQDDSSNESLIFNEENHFSEKMDLIADPIITPTIITPPITTIPINFPPSICLFESDFFIGNSRSFWIGDNSIHLTYELKASSIKVHDTNALVCNDMLNFSESALNNKNCRYIKNDICNLDNVKFSNGKTIEDDVHLVIPAGACLHDGIDYEGKELCLAPGNEIADIKNSEYDGTFRSARILAGATAMVCEYPNFTGKCYYINKNDNDLIDNKYSNNVAISSRIGSVKVFEDYTFSVPDEKQRSVIFDSNYSIGLFKDGEIWKETFLQDDEPKDNYCGPTAIKNTLSWYGEDASYGHIGNIAKTNDWIPKGEIFSVCSTIVCGGEILFCGTTCTGLASGLIGEGTSPAMLKKAMKEVAPEGYTVYSRSGEGILDRILGPLSKGNPVVTLISKGKGKLHWVVVTGIYWDIATGQYMLKLANSSNDYSWDTFKGYWSLNKVSDNKITRKILDHYGMGPNSYVMMYYSNNGEIPAKVRYYGWYPDFEYNK